MSEIWDGPWKLFDYDYATGRSTWLMHEGDKMTFRVDQPADAIIEANAEAEKETMGKRFGEWNRAASIPLELYHSSGLQEAWRQNDHAWIARFLNDSDNRKLRTSRGNV